MRPTLDGLNSSEWFRVAVALALVALTIALLLIVARYVRRGFRFIARTRRAKRTDEQWLTPRPYLMERSRGLVVWPEDEDRADGR